jgi:glycosyltransferase involved in cell wall biosynthesis
MRVGLIAPPWVPVPPPGYGGTEEVVDQLARGLQSDGHEVVLFTTGDATCPVPRKSVFATAPDDMNFSMPECRHVQAAYTELTDCDVIHDHTTLGPIWARAHGTTTPLVVTVHNPFTEVSRPVYRQIASYASIVAISRSHRESAPDVRVSAVIPHGIDAEHYHPGTGSGGFALFLGRFAPEKGAAAAIRVARLAGMPLVIAAKMRTREEQDYFDAEIKPQLGVDVTFVGEVDKGQRDSLLRDAVALINPITWREPFGLVMIEALAHGTPVIAYPNGAAPEIVDHGVTGFLADTEQAAALALRAAPSIDRARCRAAVEGYFSASRMVADYERLYGQVVFRQARRTG